MVYNLRDGTAPPASITTDMLANGVVNPTQAASNVDLTVVGTTRKRLERFEFIKDEPNHRKVKKIRVYIWGFLSAAGTGTFELWLDNDADWDVNDNYIGTGTPDGSGTTTSTTGAGIFIEIDTKSLPDGKHVLTLSGFASAAGLTLTADTREYTFDD